MVVESIKEGKIASEVTPREWASSGATGLWYIGAIALALGVQHTGLIPETAAPTAIVIATLAGLGQVICGIIELKRGDAIRGNLMLIFGIAFCWMYLGLAELVNAVFHRVVLPLGTPLIK